MIPWKDSVSHFLLSDCFQDASGVLSGPPITIAALALELGWRGLVLLAQQEALDFPGCGLWQLSDKVDPARIFVRGKAVLAEFAELGGECGACGFSVLEDDEGLRLDQAFL